MYTALDVANYLINIANQVDENDLTNLKLQKILFFCQQESFKKNGSQFFSDKIEAWKFGPVVSNVYHTYKVCGNFPITNIDINDQSYLTSLSTPDKKFIEQVWVDYGKYSANKLVQMTHEQGTPWEKNYIENENREIPLVDIKSS